MESITLTIDGKEVKVPRGITVLEACRQAGIYVPYLCWHPLLKPFGACRVCAVEIERTRGFPTSCTTTATDGMVIKTQSEALTGLRKDVVNLTLSEHPHGCLTCHRISHCGPADICLRNVSVTDRCVICPQNERCELQDVVFYLGIGSGTSVPFPYTYKKIPLEVSNPFIDHDMNLCIMCGRCVRACNELEGVDAIAFVDRGDRTIIGTSLGGSLADSGCTYCGSCVDVCPVGAIVEKDSKWAGAPDKTTPAVCPNCSIGCTLDLQTKKGKFLRSTFREWGAADGQTCVKGKFGTGFVNSKKRIQSPMLRKDGKLVEVSWAEALRAVAENLSGAKGSFAAITMGKSTNEEAYLLQKFTRAVMGTNNVYNIDPSMSQEALDGLAETLGLPAMTNSLADLQQTKAILAVDADATTDHPVLGARIRKAVQGGTKLIVIDPRETELAIMANLWLRIRPGTEGALLAGIAKVIMGESLDNSAFIQERCDNIEEFRRSLEAQDLGLIAGATGVPVERIREAARLYASSKPAAVIYSGAILNGNGEGVSAALADLALITGNLGIAGGGVDPLRGEGNSQGASDMGCSPALLPGYREVSQEDSRASLEAAWKTPISVPSGIPLENLSDALEQGSVKAVYLAAEVVNITLGSELKDALKKVPFLILQEVFSNELTELAHVVLPGAAFAEKDGTYTNFERRIQRLTKAKEPAGGSKSGWEIICAIAGEMGAAGFEYSHPSVIMDEIARLVPIYGGVSYDRIGARGLQWPCTRTDHPGTSILYAEGFAGGKAKLLPMALPAQNGHAGADGRLLALSSLCREIKGIRELNHRIELELNPADALSRGIEAGEQVRVVYPEGAITAKVKVNEGAPAGAAYITFPHSEAMAQLYQKYSSDPPYAFATQKLAWVRVEKGS